jgi:uncharacterized protein involved in response to NO
LKNFGGLVSPFSLIRNNPYRIFFPLGILFALVGVGEWIFWSLGWTIPAASLLHSSLQVQGFLSCFVVGFLMMAFPRFTGTDSATIPEIGTAFLLFICLFATLLARHFMTVQFLFAGIIVFILFFGGRRLPQRKKPFPPSFLLMGFGFLHAIVGTALVISSGLGSDNINNFTVGRQMMQVGFLLCMVLGITGQLAPFLMGYTGEPESEEGAASFVRTGRSAVFFHGMIGALIFFSFWLIPGHERWAYGVRAFAATWHFLTYARIARPVKKKTALIYFFTLSMWLILLGLWSPIILPAYRIAALHLVFIGGFSLMIFSFGQMIVLSHSGQASLLNGRLIPLKIVGFTVLLAMIFRVSADFSGSHYMILIHMASGAWVLAATLWLFNLLPKMLHGVPSEN